MVDTMLDLDGTYFRSWWVSLLVEKILSVEETELENQSDSFPSLIGLFSVLLWWLWGKFENLCPLWIMLRAENTSRGA